MLIAIILRDRRREVLPAYEAVAFPTLRALNTLRSNDRLESHRILRKGVGMPRVKEEQRGRLAALQDVLTGGSQVLLDQAQFLADRLVDVGRGVVDVGRGVEGQIGTLLQALEERLGRQVDDLVKSLTSSLRSDLDHVGERLDALEGRVVAAPKASADGVRELVTPLQGLVDNAVRTAAGVQARLDELLGRLQTVERQAHDALVHESAPAPVADERFDETRQHLERLDARLADISREVGGKLGEVGALRERLTRMENRVLETSKDQIARAGEATGLRDRLARLEARLSDLSREQVARAVEAAGLRERVFRLEQRLIGSESARMPAERVE